MELWIFIGVLTTIATFCWLCIFVMKHEKMLSVLHYARLKQSGLFAYGAMMLVSFQLYLMPTTHQWTVATFAALCAAICFAMITSRRFIDWRKWGSREIHHWIFFGQWCFVLILLGIPTVIRIAEYWLG